MNNRWDKTKRSTRLIYAASEAVAALPGNSPADRRTMPSKCDPKTGPDLRFLHRLVALGRRARAATTVTPAPPSILRTLAILLVLCDKEPL